MATVFFDRTRKTEVASLLSRFHYIGKQCADPTNVFCWRRAGGLFGSHGEPCAAALFAPPASFAWGPNAIELIRLVRDEDGTPPLTGLLSQCLKQLRRDGWTLVIAYADPDAGHHGGIYQAASWIYIGRSSHKVVYIHKESGKRSSQRSFDQSNYDPKDWNKVKTARKHTYVAPLSRVARATFRGKAKPYPKGETCTHRND